MLYLLSFISSVVLAYITYGYARTTKDMLGDAKRTREEDNTPVITSPKIEIASPQAQSAPQFYHENNIVLIRNAGNSPAFKTNVEIYSKDPDGSLLQEGPCCSEFIGIMGIGEEREIYVKLPKNLNLNGPIYVKLPQLEINITSENVYGISLQTISKFNITSDLGNWCWKKYDETHAFSSK